MNSTQHIQRPVNGRKRLLNWPLLCGLLSLASAPFASAADSVYRNDGIINYPDNVSYPPVVDATNFINNGTFIINFTTFGISQPFYETSDTLNYTNTGLMMANTGFQFDNKPSGDSARTMSGSFYNSGLVSCGSTNDVGGGFFSIGGLYYYSLSYAQCLVDATNITNPGQIEVGLNGLINLNGKKLDLSHGVLTLEGGAANLAGSGVKDLNTNAWSPGAFLGPNTAESAFFPVAPYYLYLTNSTAYIQQDGLGTSNVITRAVFIQDTSGLGITNHVYFPANSVNGLGENYAVIEWTGTYLNPADDSAHNNYLYLLNDYVEGSDTNLIYNNGIPYNFSIAQSETQLPVGVSPAAPGFSDVFPAGGITNRYAFANAQLISTSVSTNDIPDHSITNLPGRIQLLAADELNLASAHITGGNYLKLQSPNQFEGSPQLIQSTYSDVNLGVTNGFMTISNLLSPSVPNWSGTLQAWSTRWVTSDNSVTNDYRVLIVGSELSPQTLAQIQDLILHATNSLVISDTLNVMRKFTADTRNLTLTTNAPGYGATSLDGELNVGNAGIFWASALPNLRNLTNNGAIRFQNLAQFIGNSNTVSIIPGMPAVAATGTLMEVPGRGNVSAGNFVQVGSTGYTFVSKLTNSLPNRVLIAASFDGTLSNLIAAINGAPGAGTKYSTNTMTNASVAAGSLVNHALTLSAAVAGSAGNTNRVSLSLSTTNLAWSGIVTDSPISGYLSGGQDVVPDTTNTSSAPIPYDNFVNHGLLADNGSVISANYFKNSGSVSNGLGSFSLSSVATVFTNGSVQAGGDIIITADSMITSNTLLQAGRSLTLTITNLLTDNGVTNGNIWVLGVTNGTGGNGLIMPLKPAVCDLLGTTITNYTPGPNQVSLNIWPGQDRGASVSGYDNNAEVGRLILDATGADSQFKFSGVNSSNALYVDYLEFRDDATNFDGAGNLSALNIDTNMVIYYAQAMLNGVSVAEKIDHANGDRLRWVPSYAGYYSSTSLVYPPGVTNTLNAALVQSSQIDSDGDGTVNSLDPTPVFVPAEVNFNAGLATNLLPLSVRVQWSTCANATNFIYYTTNLTSGQWWPFTNFTQFYYGNNLPVANPAHANSFVSPQPYGSPATNVWVYDAITNTSHYYRVVVQPQLTHSF